jgi:hypothetical protein
MTSFMRATPAKNGGKWASHEAAFKAFNSKELSIVAEVPAVGQQLASATSIGDTLTADNGQSGILNVLTSAGRPAAPDSLLDPNPVRSAGHPLNVE